MTTNDEMQKRIVRFNVLKKQGIPLMFIDSVLPGHQRMNYAVIGDTASENTEFKPAIEALHKFQIGMGYAAPGNTPDNVEGEMTLGKWDQITIPPGLYRGFECVGKRAGWFYAVLDPHPVFKSKDPVWAPNVEQAAKLGFKSNSSGKMVKPKNYLDVRKKLTTKLKKLEPKTDARAL